MRPSIPLAVLLMLTCTMLVAATTLFAKALGNGSAGMIVPALMLSAARFLFGFLAVASFLLARRAAGLKPWAEPEGGAPAPNWRLHAARTGLGWISTFLMFSAAAHLPLSDVNALSFLSPVATMLFAGVLLRERVGPWRWLAALVALGGALVLLRPGAGVIHPAALLALGAACTMGIEAIAIKRLAMTEPPGRTMAINNGMGAVIACLAAIPVFVWPEGTLVWTLLIALGVVMVAAQILYLTANRMADASFVAPFWYASLLWAAFYDILVFDLWPDAISVIGALIVVAGGLIMTWREIRAGRRRPAGPLAR